MAQGGSYRAVFAVGEFRVLYAAQVLSVVGDQLSRVALSVLVFERTASAGLTALTYALTYLPDLVAVYEITVRDLHTGRERVPTRATRPERSSAGLDRLW